MFVVKGRSPQLVSRNRCLPRLKGALCLRSLRPCGALRCTGVRGLKTMPFTDSLSSGLITSTPNYPNPPHSLLSFIFCPRGQDLLQCLPTGSREPSAPRKRVEKQQRGQEGGDEGKLVNIEFLVKLKKKKTVS